VTAEPIRCSWAGSDPLMVAYHDDEWGVPLRDERRLFELLILEGAQAGLAWATVLRKRAAYRRAFGGWDVERVAAYGPADVERLLADPGIVRNRAKITATIGNARAILALAEAGVGFGDHLWGFVGGVAIENRWRTPGEVPAETGLSRAISRDLRARGFRFVGPVIVYALMQSAGLVNDHLVDCHRHAEVGRRA
jgi:DNA-3-methyladenine glycosylase I